jgi:biotin carboxyl carrier protein
MKYVVTINNKSYEVEVERGEAQVLSVTEARSGYQTQEEILSSNPASTSTSQTPVYAVAGEALTAPMPGTVLSVLKKTGDKVKNGDVVLILEAMKMENEVVAAVDGIITQVLVGKGSVVKTGDPLVLIH